VPDLDPLVKRLHARHPDYTGTRGEGLWRLLSDAAEGSGGFRAAIDTLLTLAAEDDLEEPRFQDVPRSYVVRYPRERLAAYARRVRTATYTNYVAPVLREYAGHLWRKPPQRSDLPVAVAQVWADVDGAGTGIDDWMRLGSRRAQLYGWAVAFVDRPAGDLTPAEARTTARWLQPDELVDWALGADGDFAWARLCTETCERDPWAEGEVEREVYTTWTRETWRRVVVEEVKVDNVKVERVVEDTGEVPHPLGRVPLVRLYWQRPEDPERIYGTSQVDGLASLALEHFNLKAELREWERGQNFGILCVQSSDADVLQRIKVGVHGGIRVEPGMGMPEFVAPPAEIGAHLIARIDGVVDAIYEQAQLQRQNADTGSTGASGEAKRQDFKGARASLTDFAQACEAAELDVARLVLAWAGGGDLGAARIAYARDFDTTSLATDLDAIFRVLRDGDVPSVKRAARLQLARAVSPDAPPAEEASTAAEVETLAELDRRALAARSSATTSPPAGTAPAGAPAQPAGNAGPITGPGAEVP